MLKLADPIYTAKMFVNGLELPEHSCQFEMRPFEDATGRYIANADEIAITSKDSHIGFSIQVFDSTNTLAWHKNYPFFVKAGQTLRLPKLDLKIPIQQSMPVAGYG